MFLESHLVLLGYMFIQYVRRTHTLKYLMFGFLSFPKFIRALFGSDFSIQKIDFWLLFYYFNHLFYFFTYNWPPLFYLTVKKIKSQNHYRIGPWRKTLWILNEFYLKFYMYSISFILQFKWQININQHASIISNNILIYLLTKPFCSNILITECWCIMSCCS